MQDSFFGQIESYFSTKKQIRPKFANGNPNSSGPNPAIHLAPQNNYWELRCEIYQIFWVYRPLLDIHKIEKSRLNDYKMLGLYGGFLDQLIGLKRVLSVTDDTYIYFFVNK